MIDFQPGMIVRARGRLWRIDNADKKTITGTSIDNPDARPRTFFLPVEGEAIQLESMDWPPKQPGDAVLHDLFLRATRMTMMHGTAPLASLQRSRVIPTNYQLVPVMMALDMPRTRLLIADDVGLGKTIEAGLITVELLARKQAERVLVLTPANLREQWREAFEHFFHLDFEVMSTPNLRRLGRKLPPGANPWAHFPHVIASIDYAKQDKVKNLILAQDWDLVIVDEAHGAAATVAGARGGGTKDRYEFVRDLARQCEHLILATATPHNGYTTSFASLLRMLDERSEGRRVTQVLGLVEGDLAEPKIRRERAKRHIVQRRREDVMEWFEREDKRSPFPKRNAKEVLIEPSKPEQEVYRAFQEYQRFVFRDSGAEDIHVLAKWMVMHFLRRATSSPRALKESLRNRIARLEAKLEVAAEEGEDSISAGAEQALKSAALDTGGSDLYGEEELDEKLDRLSVLDRANLQAEIGFLQTVLDAVNKWRPGSDTKLKTLKDLLLDPAHLGTYPRTIVFTRYVDTMEYLAAELGKEEGLEIFEVHGSLNEKARAERIQDFQRSKRAVLVATDSISEGLNLQFAANQLVHYELPWNPNRLEQRNGRVDRFKQPELEVRIRTLINERSFDLVVFRRLIQKAQAIREAYGFLPGYFSDEKYLEGILSDIIDENLLTQKFQQPGLFEEPESLDIDPETKALADKMRDESFYGQATFHLPDVEERLSRTQATIGSPEEVERLVVDALRYLDWRVNQDRPGIYAIHRSSGTPVDGIPDELGRVTFDPDVGAANPELAHLDIAHPVVTRLLRIIKQRSYVGLQNARTAVSVRKLPKGTGAHAVFHVRARFRVGGDEDAVQLIEGLVPVAIDLRTKQPASHDTSIDLLTAAKRPNAFTPSGLQRFIDIAYEVPELNGLIQHAIAAEGERLHEERAALKERLLEAYPSEAAWLKGIDRVKSAASDVLALSIIVPEVS